MENYDSIIQMDYINPHSYEAFDEFTIKMVFTISEEELDFIPPPDCELIYKPAASIATAVAEYILQHDPQNLTDDDKLSLKLLYGKWNRWSIKRVIVFLPWVFSRLHPVRDWRRQGR